MNKRIQIRTILADERLRRKLLTHVIQATQNREGIATTLAQAEAAYDKIRAQDRRAQ